MVSLLTLFALLMVIGSAVVLRAAAAELDLAERSAMYETILQEEVALLVQGRDQLVRMQGATEATIEGTTRLVHAIHRGVAGIPFGVLEAIPATRDSARLVRGVHDLTAAGVYETIAAVNRGVGRGLRRGIDLRVPKIEPQSDSSLNKDEPG